MVPTIVLPTRRSSVCLGLFARIPIGKMVGGKRVKKGRMRTPLLQCLVDKIGFEKRVFIFSVIFFHYIHCQPNPNTNTKVLDVLLTNDLDDGGGERTALQDMQCNT
ncbi:hypothetical protein TRVL_05638 [Trypanosoma vivax]|nr:hypothetical protein TRVL_05638 [Trypanosoma vivax]